jgi:hypothetical protein
MPRGGQGPQCVKSSSRSREGCCCLESHRFQPFERVLFPCSVDKGLLVEGRASESRCQCQTIYNLCPFTLCASISSEHSSCTGRLRRSHSFNSISSLFLQSFTESLKAPRDVFFHRCSFPDTEEHHPHQNP